MRNDLEFKKVLSQVPPNYYALGVKSNWLQRFWHTKKWRELCEFLAGDSGKLLDIGCADGTTTAAILKCYPNLRITAIDYYDSAIGFAKKNYDGINFKTADASNLPFKDGEFDLVTTIEVLEHLPKPKEALLEVTRVLKKGGRLIVVQDTDSLLFRAVWWFWTKWKGSVWNDSHISCVGPDELVTNIKKSGFRIGRRKFTNLKMEVFIEAIKL